MVQRGSREPLLVPPYQAEAWHKSRASLGTSVQIKSTSSLWSFGTVDLNEVGRSVLHLPTRGGSPTDTPFVVLVEVKMAEPSDRCSVVVVIWQASVETSTALAIRNDSDVSITVIQADIEFDLPGGPGGLGAFFEVCVPPAMCVPFGWADPDGSTDILVTVGSCMSGAARVVKVNFLKAGEKIKLPDNTGGGHSGDLMLSVVAEGGGRVMHVTRTEGGDPNRSSKALSLINSSKSVDSDGDGAVPSFSFGLTVSLASFGLSLVVERPVRREFLSLYLEGLEGRVKTKGAIRSFELMVMDLQVDNYSESVVYPVLLHRIKKDKAGSQRRGSTPVAVAVRVGEGAGGAGGGGDGSAKGVEEEEETEGSERVPLLQVSLIEESNSLSSSSTLKYVAIR